jgi:hypothetical protein
MLVGLLTMGCSGGDDSGVGGGGAGDGAGASTTLVSASASTGTAAASNGAGGAPPEACLVIEDCHDALPECSAWTCDGVVCMGVQCTEGVCVASHVPDGTPAADPIDGDCKALVCDGNGGTREIDDTTDPEDDGKECTIDACTVPVHTPAPKGTPCSQEGGHLCDGTVCAAYVPARCAVGPNVWEDCDGVVNPTFAVRFETSPGSWFTCGSPVDWGYCAPGTPCEVVELTTNPPTIYQGTCL